MILKSSELFKEVWEVGLLIIPSDSFKCAGYISLLIYTLDSTNWYIHYKLIKSIDIIVLKVNIGYIFLNKINKK